MTKEQQNSLKKLSIHGFLWSFGGHGAGELIRLASNLILTRLLMPEDFGLMLMVNLVMIGLQLFSNIGIVPSIIQNPRGEDQRFLNTAWTIQAIRGFVLWIAAALLAHPFSVLYDMPKLAELIPVAAFSAVIAGFSSTKLASLNRKLHLGKITILQLGQTLVSVTVMIIWALISPTTWALVAGGIMGRLFHTILSQFITSGPYNRLAWDHGAFKELFKFGKWIFLTTVISFFASRADRLILGKIMTGEELGLLSIALILAQNIPKLLTRVGSKVLFPLYTRLAKDNQTHLINRIVKVRSALMAITIPPLCILTVWGSDIIEFVWDPRYKEAGWMLQILAAGGIIRVINMTIAPIQLAMGDSYRQMVYTACIATVIAMTMGVGIAINGTTGAIIGVAIAPAINYFILVFLIRRYNVWTPLVDLIAVLFGALLIGIGFAIA